MPFLALTKHYRSPRKIVPLFSQAHFVKEGYNYSAFVASAKVRFINALNNNNNNNNDNSVTVSKINYQAYFCVQIA